MGRWIRVLKRNRADSVILAGAVTKTDMFRRFGLFGLIPDWRALKIWYVSLSDKRNDSVLSAVADELERHGVKMRDCIEYSAEHLAPDGVLTNKQPSASQLRDANFGWSIAKEIGRLDIGQTIAVKDTEVVAVEAIEGTDQMIERAGRLVRHGGWTLIKVAKPNQDMRFDVPTVGPETIGNLAANGAGMLVIEGGKTLIIDRRQMIADADRHGIVVLSRTNDSPDEASPLSTRGD